MMLVYKGGAVATTWPYPFERRSSGEQKRGWLLLELSREPPKAGCLQKPRYPDICDVVALTFAFLAPLNEEKGREYKKGQRPQHRMNCRRED